MVLVCNKVCLQNHGQKVIKDSHHSASYVVHSHCDSRDIFLVCHMILEDHVTGGGQTWEGATKGKSPSDQVW